MSLPPAMLLAATLVAGLFPPSAAELTVRVGGLESDAGEIVIALFDSSSAFSEGGEPLRSDYLPVTEAPCEWVIEGLPPGNYAVKVFHDLNGNRDLDRRKMGIPVEPYGFSNNARAPFGPPSFEQARFELGAEPRALEIELRGGRR